MVRSLADRTFQLRCAPAREAQAAAAAAAGAGLRRGLLDPHLLDLGAQAREGEDPDAFPVASGAFALARRANHRLLPGGLPAADFVDLVKSLLKTILSMYWKM